MPLRPDLLPEVGVNNITYFLSELALGAMVWDCVYFDLDFFLLIGVNPFTSLTPRCRRGKTSLLTVLCGQITALPPHMYLLWTVLIEVANVLNSSQSGSLPHTSDCKCKYANKILQKCHYCGIFYHYFCNNSGRKLKKNFVKFLRYGNPDILFFGNPGL